jgi:hypothetical protein
VSETLTESSGCCTEMTEDEGRCHWRANSSGVRYSKPKSPPTRRRSAQRAGIREGSERLWLRWSWFPPVVAVEDGHSPGGRRTRRVRPLERRHPGALRLGPAGPLPYSENASCSLATFDDGSTSKGVKDPYWDLFSETDQPQLPVDQWEQPSANGSWQLE